MGEDGFAQAKNSGVRIVDSGMSSNSRMSTIRRRRRPTCMSPARRATTLLASSAARRVGRAERHADIKLYLAIYV